MSKAYIPTKEEFLETLPNIRKVARELGYAIGLHGSLERDFDLIAAPWADDAVDADTLAEAVKTAAKCVRWRIFPTQGDTNEPYGRRVYCFDWDEENFANKGYIDLSVMSRYGIANVVGSDIASDENFIQNKFGYCFYTVSDHEHTMLFNLYVHPEYRHQGKARQLVQFAIRAIRESGFTGEIRVEARPTESGIDLKRLIKFYKSMDLVVIDDKYFKSIYNKAN